MQYLKTNVVAILVIALVLAGTGFAAVPVTQAFIPVAGKILAYYPPSPQPTANMHLFGPPFPGMGYCTFCLGPVGVGQWFIGQMAGTVVVTGMLGGY